MKSIRFCVTGTILQGMGIAAFIVISRTGLAGVGEPIVVGLTLIGLALLLWHEVKQTNTWAMVVTLPALLAVGYVIAFHAIGVLAFPGLLRDVEFSTYYLLAVLRVTGIVFALYVVGGTLIYIVNRLLTHRLESD